MEPWENNFLLSICLGDSSTQQSISVQKPLQRRNRNGGEDEIQVGLAWVDLSTGDFFTQTTSYTNLPSVMAKISAREIVLHATRQEELEPFVEDMSKEEQHIITYHELSDQEDSKWQMVLDAAPEEFKVESFSPLEIDAANLLLHYVDKQLLDFTVHLQPPVRQDEQDIMNIDKNTLRALEIRQTLRDGKSEGSLLHTIRGTVTKSGARLLSQRLGMSNGLGYNWRAQISMKSES